MTKCDAASSLIRLFVAQEKIDFPVRILGRQRAGARSVALRFIWLQAGQLSRDAGGLTRVSPEAGGRFVSMQRAGSSKDTWVLSETPVEEITCWRRPGRTWNCAARETICRAVWRTIFYWLGVLRAGRRQRANFAGGIAAFQPERAGARCRYLRRCCAAWRRKASLHSAKNRRSSQNPEALEAELLAAIFDPARSGSLRSIVENMFRLAAQVRDRTSNDMCR